MAGDSRRYKRKYNREIGGARGHNELIPGLVGSGIPIELGPL